MNNPDKNKDNSTTQLTIEDKDTHKAAANFDITHFENIELNELTKYNARHGALNTPQVKHPHAQVKDLRNKQEVAAFVKEKYGENYKGFGPLSIDDEQEQRRYKRDILKGALQAVRKVILKLKSAKYRKRGLVPRSSLRSEQEKQAELRHPMYYYEDDYIQPLVWVGIKFRDTLPPGPYQEPAVLKTSLS